MRGQMLLLVVLVMVIVLTVGLAAASRTITNLRIASNEENSERAFSAAEAGLEIALNQTTGLVTGTLDNASTYRTTLSNIEGVEFLLNNNIAVLKDDAADVWLSQYPNYSSQYTGNMTVYWGSSADLCNTSETINTMAALDIVIVSGNSNNPILRHVPVDPCALRRSNNQFGNVSAGGYDHHQWFDRADYTALCLNGNRCKRLQQCWQWLFATACSRNRCRICGHI
jgi:hypothetical protein